MKCLETHNLPRLSHEETKKTKVSLWIVLSGCTFLKLLRGSSEMVAAEVSGEKKVELGFELVHRGFSQNTGLFFTKIVLWMEPLWKKLIQVTYSYLNYYVS